MRYLLPFVCAVLVFFAAHYFRPVETPVTPQVSQTVPRNTTHVKLRGLERRAKRLDVRENAKPATLDRLFRAGSLAFGDRWDMVRRSAEADPEGTWAWLEAQELSHNDKYNLRNAATRACFTRHPELVLSHLKPGDSVDQQIAGHLIDNLNSKDPADAAAVRAHLDELVALVGNQREAILLPKPEDGGGELLLSLPPGPTKDILVNQFARQWLEKDIAAARAWMTKLPVAQTEVVMTGFVDQWVFWNASPEGKAFAAEWIQNEASPATRARLGPKLAESMAEKDPAAALAWANENLSAAPLASATGRIVSQLFTKDPEQARQTVEDLPPGNLRHNAAAAVADAWCAKEPAAAIHWWLDQVDQQEAEKAWGLSAAHLLGNKWLETNPDSLRQYLADPASRQLPGSLTDAAVQEWSRKDPVATLDWITSLPEERRMSVSRTAFQMMAYKDPPAAAREYVSRPELATPSAARSVASAWFGQDHEAAIQWVAALPNGPARNEALNGLKSGADFEVRQGAAFPQSLKELLR